VPGPAHNRVRRSRYVDVVDILYISTNGSADATKASIPWHLAVNGSVEVGQTARIVLAGDAAEMVKAGVREGLEGVGVPPLRDLVAKARANGVSIHV
jgi:predicted peroxiredoxin